MAGFDVKKLREAEEAMVELKRQSARLRQLASEQQQEKSPELVKAADQLEAAADELLKTIHDYRLSIQ